MKRKLLIAGLGFIAFGSFATGIARHAHRSHRHHDRFMNKVAQVCVDAAQRSKESPPNRPHFTQQAPPTYVPYPVAVPYALPAPAPVQVPVAVAPQNVQPRTQPASTLVAD